MRKLLLIIMFACGMQAAFAQTRPDSLRAADTSGVSPVTPVENGTKARQQTFDSYNKSFNDGISASSKANFWDFVGQVGGVLDNTSTGISLDPTLAKLGFGKAQWLNDIQLNFTPITKAGNFLKYDSLNYGVTWAIINHYSWKKVGMDSIIQRYLQLNQELYRSIDNSVLKNTVAYPDALKIYNTIEQQTSAGKLSAAAFDNLPLVSKIYLLKKLNGLPGNIPDKVKADQTLHKFLDFSNAKTVYMTSAADDLINASPADITLVNEILADEFNDAFDAVNAAMKKKEQLNFAVSTENNFVTHRWQGIYFAPNYTNYFGHFKQWSYTVKASYSFEIDTIHPAQGWTRQLLKITPDIDWLPLIKDTLLTKASFLELKASAEYDKVFTGAYPKAKATPVSPALTVTLNITDSLSLPITIKYDDNKSSLFGFLTVQYTPGSGTSKSQ